MSVSKPGVLDGIPVINEIIDDATSAIQDSQHTTIENALRLIIKDKYTPNVELNNLQQGVVMREIKSPNDFEYSQKYELQTLTNKSVVPIRYKIFILGRYGSIIPVPKTYDESSIEILDDYTPAPNFEGVLSVGMIVYVDVKNRTIVYTDDKSVNISAANNSKKVGEGNPSMAFKNNSKQSGGPVNIDKIPQEVTEEEAFSSGKSIGKIKLKTIVSYSSQKMREDAADKFNEMCKAAASDGIKLIASSGFRSQESQINIYNDRFVNKYPAGRKNNPLTENGKKIGVAAYPGTSNHQSGVAVDVDVGTHLAESNRYAGAMGNNPVFKWLSANAYKFGFDNLEGRSVNEPWHWVFKKQLSSIVNSDDNADGADGGKNFNRS